ncbi:Phosphatidylinositol N-acetylglucosaminyltransferase GPI2 subunit [Hypsizygus marmoreus]|uniref:Phosphatidylinositol N-acetylglucosaminyltransferase GPI2 subunit n=1 Tax=Hypsizygus marmoreus TaxID=39966 RepID=A0A369K1L2_HYPMA|nr:Phosphatidylinositol N-acetylglucosaminyltransferase GPI2 subunit [Hypsizygus marmoreus]
MSTQQAPRVWEKTLWKKQPVPDNYIPPASFLSSLERNPNFTPYAYWPLVLLSCAITQHLSTIFIFLATFVRLNEQLLDPLTLICISVGCFIIGYAIWERGDYILACQSNKSVNRLKAVKSSILIFLVLMALSPVLRTLTAATSSDSIWALSAVLFILNALLADYSSQKTDGQIHERLTSVLSMNAALSASVVLASRLRTDVAVFALILFSVQTFALFPMLRHRLQASPAIIQTLLALSLSALAIFLTIPLSWITTCLFSATLFSVAFLAPAILVWAQKFKNEIRGPWDVAVPKVN